MKLRSLRVAVQRRCNVSAFRLDRNQDSRPSAQIVLDRLNPPASVFKNGSNCIRLFITKLNHHFAAAAQARARLYPLIEEVKLVLWGLLPAVTQPWMLVQYVLSVLVTVTIGLGLGLLLTRAAPKAFSLLNGGRVAAA